MVDEPHDRESELDDALRILDSMPPEDVKRALLAAGLTDSALDTPANLARGTEDPEIRVEALRFIEEHHLELILLSDADDAAG